MLRNNINAAICLLDTPFDGCHNSKNCVYQFLLSQSGQKGSKFHYQCFLICFARFAPQCTITSTFSPTKLSVPLGFHIVLIIENTRITLARIPFSL